MSDTVDKMDSDGDAVDQQAQLVAYATVYADSCCEPEPPAPMPMLGGHPPGASPDMPPGGGKGSNPHAAVMARRNLPRQTILQKHQTPAKP